MHKTFITDTQESPLEDEFKWLDLQDMVNIELSSEQSAYPIENALLEKEAGWRAETTGKQVIRLQFIVPQSLSRIQLVFEEAEQERTQEFTLRWSGDAGRNYSEIVRQQWSFSPAGSKMEIEDYKVDLAAVNSLELTIEPDISNAHSYASLSAWRLG